MLSFHNPVLLRGMCTGCFKLDAMISIEAFHVIGGELSSIVTSDSFNVLLELCLDEIVKTDQIITCLVFVPDYVNRNSPTIIINYSEEITSTCK